MPNKFSGNENMRSEYKKATKGTLTVMMYDFERYVGSIISPDKCPPAMNYI